MPVVVFKMGLGGLKKVATWSSLLSVGVLGHSDQKHLGEERGLFHLTRLGNDPSLRSLRQEQRPEPCRAGAHWLSPYLTPGDFLIQPRPTNLEVALSTEG